MVPGEEAAITIPLTHAMIRTLLPKGKLYRVGFIGNPGLYLQVTPRGVMTWIYRYRFGTDEHSLGLGHYPSINITGAREELDLLRVDVIQGRDPAVARAELLRTLKPPAPPVTLRQVAERYYAEWTRVECQPATQRQQRSFLDRLILPALGDLALAGITPPVVNRFLDTLAPTPVQANRVASLVGSIYSWAKPRYTELAGSSRWVEGIKRHRETASERRLSEAEIRQVGEAYRTSTHPLRHAAIWLLLSGCRSGVVLVGKPEHRFPDEHLLRFPPRTPGLKNLRAVHLGAPSVKLLDQVPYDVTEHRLADAWASIRPAGSECSLHDLRRTFASVGVDLGISEAVVDALLGHTRGKIRDTYMVRADKTLLAAADQISSHIAGLLGLS
jgi:integrase